MISFWRPWIAAATATVRRCRVTSSRRGWPRRRYAVPRCAGDSANASYRAPTPRRPSRRAPRT